MTRADVHDFIRELRGASRATWESLALEFYADFYRMDGTDHTHSEARCLRALDRALRLTTPEIYRTGVHLIGRGMAACGEDIYVVDGELNHTLWLVCAGCNEAQLLQRGDRLWCVPCACYVEMGKSR